MKISKLKTMTNPNPVDVLLALDIDGGSSQNPTLRLVTLQSILAMVKVDENPATQAAIDNINSSLSTLNTTVVNSLVDVNTALGSLQTQIDAISEQETVVDLSEIEASILNLETSVSSINDRSNNIEFLQGNLQSNFNGLTATVVQLDVTVNTQVSYANFLTGLLVALTARVDAIDTALANIKLPTTFQHFHDTSKVLVGAPLSRVQLAASIYVSQYQQSPALLNDSFSFTQLLEAGTYELRMNVTRANNKGDLELRINGTLAFDDVSGYNSTVLHEDIIRTITIPTNGLHDFVFKVKGKNASSSNYFWLMSKVSARKI